MRTDRLTGMTKVIVAFSNFANSPKNLRTIVFSYDYNPRARDNELIPVFVSFLRRIRQLAFSEYKTKGKEVRDIGKGREVTGLRASQWKAVVLKRWKDVCTFLSTCGLFLYTEDGGSCFCEDISNFERGFDYFMQGAVFIFTSWDNFLKWFYPLFCMDEKFHILSLQRRCLGIPLILYEYEAKEAEEIKLV